MIVDIFIKTCPKDYEFLDHCLFSISKRAKYFRDVVIVTEDEDYDLDRVGNDLNARVINLGKIPENKIRFPGRSTPRGYEYQKGIKCMWHQYSDADAAFVCDSDYLFTGDVTVYDLFKDGLPIWCRKEWDDLPDDHVRAWKRGNEWFHGGPVPWSYMTGPGFLITRELAQKFQEHVYNKFEATPLELFLNPGVPQITEFELLGLFADYYGKDFELPYHWASPEERYLPIVQFWSWGGMTDTVKAVIEENLA